MNRRLELTGKGSFFPNLSAPQYRLRLVARYLGANHPTEVHAFGSNHEPRLSLQLELCGLISAHCHSYMSFDGNEIRKENWSRGEILCFAETSFPAALSAPDHLS